MRSSSLLVALQAGCLTLAAPAALGFSSHQRRACAPSSIESQETNYYHHSEMGTADRRKAVEMCIRVTVPAPCTENRPRTPSSVEIVPCDSEPQAPETNQIYLRLTLPDPAINEGHRTPSIVDPSPFATYSEYHAHQGDDAGASESSESQRMGSASGGHSGEATDSSEHRQGGGPNGETPNDDRAVQTNATGPQVPPSSEPSSEDSAGAESTAGRKGPSQNKEEPGQGHTETHEASPGSIQGKDGVQSASNEAGTNDGDSDGTFRSGSNHAARPSSNSSPSTSSAAKDDEDSSLIKLKVHAAAFNEASPTSSVPTDFDVGNGPLLSVKVNAAAVQHSDSSDTPVSSTNHLLSVKADIAKHPLDGGPVTNTPGDDVLGSDALIHLAAGVGFLDGQHLPGSNLPSADSASQNLGNGPLLSGKVHAAALHGVSHGDSPVTNALDAATDRAPNGDIINPTSPNVSAHGVVNPVGGAPSDKSTGVEVLGSVNQNAAHLPTNAGSMATAIVSSVHSDIPQSDNEDNGHMINGKATVSAPSTGSGDGLRQPSNAPEPHASLRVEGSTSADPTKPDSPVDDAMDTAN